MAKREKDFSSADEVAPLKTSEVARFCHVSPEVVALWIRNNKLNAYSTPGGHYRIPVAEFVRFLEENGMPIPDRFKVFVRRCILVIDDEPTWTEFVADVLQDEYKVVTALNGIDGLIKIGVFRPELVILDALMPGLDGRDVVKILRENPEFKGLKVLVATGYPQDRITQAMSEIGVAGILSKPVTPEELRTRARQLLAHGTSTPAEGT